MDTREYLRPGEQSMRLIYPHRMFAEYLLTMDLLRILLPFEMSITDALQPLLVGSRANRVPTEISG
jgi:hypothetical protein